MLVGENTNKGKNAAHSNNMINTIANFRQDPASAVDLDVIWPILTDCNDVKIATVTGKCGSAPYTYLWQRSQNGINWSNIGTANSSTISLPAPPISNSTTTYLNSTFSKYKVTVTDAYNHSITSYKNYYKSCDPINANKIGITKSNLESTIVPNPNNSEFVINLSEEFKDDVKLQIIDMLGKIVYSVNYKNVLNKIEISNIKKLAKGSYVVKITNSVNKIETLKLLIN